ncbi:MAG: hypothetical protein QXI58_06385 [Candidatus Micrarchaeia archaeon]
MKRMTKKVTPEEIFIRTGKIEKNINFNRAFKILSKLISINWRKFARKFLVEGIIHYPSADFELKQSALYYNQLTPQELTFLRNSIEAELDLLIGFHNNKLINEIMCSLKSMSIANIILSHNFEVSRRKALVFNEIIKQNPFLKVFSFSDGDEIEIFVNKNFINDVRVPIHVVSSYLGWKKIVENSFLVSNILEGEKLSRFEIGRKLIPKPSIHEFIHGFEISYYYLNYTKDLDIIKGICLIIGRGIYDIEKMLGENYLVSTIRAIAKGFNPIKTEINELNKVYSLSEIAVRNKIYNKARNIWEKYCELIYHRLINKPSYDSNFVRILELMKFQS